MKISEMKEAYLAASEKVSELVRQLALAGIAVVWILRVGGENSGGVKFSNALLWPLSLFVAALGADLFQYAYKTIAWWGLNTYHWSRHGNNEHDADVSGLWNAITWFLFLAKTSLLVWAYVCLLNYMIKQLGLV